MNSKTGLNLKKNLKKNDINNFIYTISNFSFLCNNLRYNWLSIQKKRIHISASLISVHYFLLNKYVAGLIVIVSLIRFITAYFTTNKNVMYLFLIANLLIFVLLYENIIDVIVLVASLFGTFAAFQKNDKLLRQYFMIGTTFFIIYNSLIFTPMGIVIEVIFLFSNFFGYHKHYLKIKV